MTLRMDERNIGLKDMDNNLKYLKGAIHLHTNLSHDGTISIEQLAAFLKSKGYNFIAITEHSYDVDNNAMQYLSNKAISLSSDDFTIIPGIEFRCHDDIDIMGLGVIQMCEHESPQKVIAHIHNCRGVAVWAHPSFRDYPFERQWLEKLDGAEIWNQIHDSRFIPHSRSIKRFNNLLKGNSNLKAFCGLDMHTKNSYYFVSTTVSVHNNDQMEILAALRGGSFKTQSRFFNFDANERVTLFYYSYIWAFNYLINIARWLRDILSHG